MTSLANGMLLFIRLGIIAVCGCDDSKLHFLDMLFISFKNLHYGCDVRRLNDRGGLETFSMVPMATSGSIQRLLRHTSPNMWMSVDK